MPKVGKKEFAYTPKGEAAAEAYSEETGIPVTNAPDMRENYQWGGRVLPPQGLPQGGLPRRPMSPVAPPVAPVGRGPGMMYEEGGKVKKYKKGGKAKK